MSSGPLRRAQLIAPFGVGALSVIRDGTSVITCGLDHWYKQEGEVETTDIQEFKIFEWRLQKRLNVSHFRLPPDFRKKWRNEEIPNCYLTIPVLRFPKWHYCQTCHTMVELPLSVRGRVKCRECEKNGKTRYVVQVPFVAVCDQGHIQDFPWREWVHESSNPRCNEKLKLISTGGATLAGQIIKCSCGAQRNLGGITTAFPNGSTLLSEKLDKNGYEYNCKGKRPWLGSDLESACGRPLRGSLRSASNVYFAQVYSSIYIPRGTNKVPSELITLLEDPPLSTVINLLSKTGQDIKSSDLRDLHGLLLKPYTDDQINSGLKIVLGKEKVNNEELSDNIEGEDQETQFRRVEFNVLCTEKDEEQLKIRKNNITQYDPTISKFFSKIMLVDKLRETRALAGFRRIFPDNEQSLEDMKALLWQDYEGIKNNWLPAYIVYGEGIFLEFNEELLQQWLKQNKADIEKRIKPLVDRYQQVQQDRHLRERIISPRFILLHTFAHLLINRLTFECGYSSASLRERLYISDNPTFPMGGILIYTAAGDSEGTMGGLVRMGKPGYFEPVVKRALENAKWCSADPVCMEMALRGGQGPNSCNLAACHNCALVPETACEEFNMFLDRGLVVGDISNDKLGYFNTF
ncbi:hypothetical protein B0537_10795 [Desulforamulus ferrireducens]|uniref:MrfA-like Zn-binding domain-containing protein n=2 Tax=Desulforamulus ferrireducens TaxID=1833852 RepID=A0A1S6IXM2_9FIRM|nr:DUF1998 domain-containing protein [Desulforamulus ferrireducens]AQS59524.1 hypothetical protein B0537_10795 [Desulforamulus ferrireducens]